MSFKHPEILYFLFLIPFIAFWYHYFFQKRKKVLKKFFSDKNLNIIAVSRSRFKNFIKTMLICCVIFFLILAIAGPQYGYKEIVLESSGLNIFLAIDTSKSMDAQDIKPSRIKLAKFKIQDFLSRLNGERVSLIAFAGVSFICVPLTIDYGIFTNYFDIIDTDLIPVQGTNFYNLIKKVNDVVNSQKLTNAYLIIFSDGEDFGGNIKQALQICKKNNIKIITIGIGKKEAVPIPLPDGSLKKDKKGNIVTTRLNEKFLEKIALATDGLYIRATTSLEDIDFLYKKISKIQKKGEHLEKKRIYYNRFQWFLLPALLLFFLYLMIDERKKIFLLIVFFLGINILMPNKILFANPYFENKKGIEQFNKGQFSASFKHFNNAYKEDKREEYLFNMSDVLIKQKKYKNAEELLNKLINSPDKKIKQFSYYNRGIIFFNEKKYHKALENFKKSIILNPNDLDARINYELTLKKLKENQDNKSKKNNNKSKNKNNKDNKKSGKNENKKEQQRQNKVQIKPKNSKGDKKKIDEKILNLYDENKKYLKNSIQKKFKGLKNPPIEKDW